MKQLNLFDEARRKAENSGSSFVERDLMLGWDDSFIDEDVEMVDVEIKTTAGNVFVELHKPRQMEYKYFVQGTEIPDYIDPRVCIGQITLWAGKETETYQITINKKGAVELLTMVKS